jgi:RND family efflux transporter MFP subunit
VVSMGRPLLLLVTGLLFMLCLPSVSFGAATPEFDGLIEPYMTVKLGSSDKGVLETVDVDRGDFVKKGQVVATLQAGVEKATEDLARFRAQLDATIEAKRVSLAFAERSLQRFKDLYSRDIISYKQVDEEETKRLLAEKELQEALDNKRIAELEFKRSNEVVNRIIIRSTVKGVVVERLLSPGEYVQDQPILKLAQIDPLYVEVVVPVAFFGSVKVGMRATVKPEPPVGGEYTARVKIVDRVVDAASGTFGVRLELPNPNYKLPAGLKCKVSFPNN